MNVSVALEQRFVGLADGSIWTQGAFAYPFWRRYLDVFDTVRCIARIRHLTELDSSWRRADGPQVQFVAVPHYVGPSQFVRHAWAVRRAARKATESAAGAFILRLPGAIGDLAWAPIASRRSPFGIELVGDPHEVFAPHAVRHALRPLLRRYATRRLRRQCRSAAAVLYVTSSTLQRRYPSSGEQFSASSIELRDDAFVAVPRHCSSLRRARLLFVGSLEQYYKGPDVLIAALAHAVQRGWDLSLTLIGDGRIRPDLERIAAASGCAGRIRFAGQVSAEQVRSELDRADLFVLPSRTEGLPRAMIEAMARALPCIASRAGGIPELLPDAALAPPGDATALAHVIMQTVGDGPLMSRMSARNLDVARAYREEQLAPRRREFYRVVRDATDAWLRHPSHQGVA